MTNRYAAALCTLLLAFVPACSGGNNIGRLFDPDLDGPDSGSGDVSNVAAVPVGGKSVDGRPSVEDAFPKGGGWPDTVPIVVVFNESVNADSVAPPSTSDDDETVFVRVVGTETPLPATYDFLLGDTVVVIRPLQPLVGAEGTSFEVVVAPQMRDADGIRYGGSDVEVVATFQTDAADDAVDGEIVTILPLDNSEDQIRETPVYAVFSRAANSASVTTANFRLRTSSLVGVSGTLSFPLETAPTIPDTRVLRFEPSTTLAANTEHQIVVDDTITFGSSGVLEFRGRVPWSVFDTTGTAQPVSTTVGNPAMGFPDKVNLGNFANLTVFVETPADTVAGDRARVRLYGLDAETAGAGDVNFVERTADITMDGAQTVTVDFSSSLGTLASPIFEDGDLIITARLLRGSTSSGYIRSAEINEPRFDMTRPTLTSIGPPAGQTATDIVTDQQLVSLFGVASERLGELALTVGMNTAQLYASSANGRFVSSPVDVGILPGVPAAYSLTITDAAGNMSATSASGNVIQRGVVAGAQAGTLTVEAFDDTTLLPVPGATVIIEPGMPQKPAVGQIVATTDTAGRASFTGLGAMTYSVTIVANGYHLMTLVETQGAFVSMPLRPLTNATGSVGGSLAFVPLPTQTALVGLNTYDDRVLEAVETTTANPGTLSAQAVRPNRPIFATGFSGSFPPTGLATFANFGCGICGADSLSPTPPFLPPDPGDTNNISLTLIPGTGAVANLAAPYSVDFAPSTGLGAISGTPSVNVVATMQGFGGMPLAGVGFATSTGGTAYSVNASYLLRLPQILALFLPQMWVSIEAQDADGNVARMRRLILDPTVGTTAATTATPGIPTITAPGGPITGSPSVGYEDRLDASLLVGGFAIAQLRATDGNGRHWDVLWVDGDNAAGATSVQLPDLSGQSVIGLATGSWDVQIENLLFSTISMTATSYTFEERYHTLVTYAKAKSETFTIQ